tara:strand:- start:705 stop:1451 length:747 start_codon:yes stop_codon:yes gene_type:complete
MRYPKILLAATALLSLSGCYSMQGPERLVAKDAKPADLRYSDIKMFVDDFNKAREFRVAQPDALNSHVVPMLRSGFMYNYSFCENYFNIMAKNQRRSKISRSLLAPLTSVITGIIGLQDFSSNPGSKEDLVQGLAIGSAAATSILDIYDEHFLFGTDNIDSVETMTLKALDVHSSSVLKQEEIRFESGMKHLIDNQGQCSPQSILTLARSSIKNSDIVATNINATKDDDEKKLNEKIAGKVTVGVKSK